MLGDAGKAYCRITAGNATGRRPRLAHGPIGMIGLRQGFARAEFLPQRCFLLTLVPHPRG